MIEAGILLFLILILITFGLYIWRRTTGSARRKLHLAGRVAALSLVILPLALFVTYKLMNARTYQVFGRIVPRVDASWPLIALTFDDGPQAPYTNELLSVLREKGAKATFFVIGGQLEKFPALGEQIVKEGHELGNHSYSHQRMIFKSPDFIQSELTKTDQLIRQTGYAGEIHFRSPYGKKLFLLPVYLSRADRRNIFWDVEPDSYPEITASAERIVGHVVSHARPGSIILLHAETGSRGQSLNAVPGIIEKLKSKGYSFVTVSELLAAEIRMSGRQPMQSREPKQGPVKDRLRRGKRILQRAQRAMGGAEKLSAVKDVTHKLEVALEPAAGGFRIKQVSLYVAPNHIRQEQETPFGNIKVYTDGKSGWLATPQGVQSIPADVLETAKGVVFRQPTTLMLSDRDASRSVAAVSNNAVEISTTDGQSVRIEFDSVTGLPARQLYLEIGAAGPRERTEIFSDWRDVGGIKMPYKAVQQENGAKMLEVTVSEYRINSGITADLLSKRP